MPNPTLQPAAMVSIRCSIRGENVQTGLVFEWIDSAQMGDSDVMALADDTYTEFGVKIMPLLSEDLIAVNCEGRALDTLIPNPQVYVPATQVTGGTVSPVNNIVEGCLVSHRTGTAGRSYRGRSYLPGVASANMVDDLIPTAYQTSLALAWGDMIDNIEGANWRQVILSRFGNGLERPVPLLTPVTTFYLPDSIVTQRRRRPPYRAT